MKVRPLFIAVSVALLPAFALAHTHLLRSSPGENEVLANSPPSATLVFAEPVTLTGVKIESKNGLKTTLKPPPAKPAAEATVALPALAPSRYTMSWRAVGRDGHIMSGEIHFTVGEHAGT